MDEAVALVVAPFRDIVDKGKTALNNAGEKEDMRKAAQTLMREGERALTRIEPLCKKHVDEYAANFINALKEDESITKFRSELNDLLWEFDDYLEPDDFDQAKFDELRAASRKAAPQILDILTRMKLEAPPKPATPANAFSPISPPTSPQRIVAMAANSIPFSAMPPPRPPPNAPLPPLPVSGSSSRRKSMVGDAAILGGVAQFQEAHAQHVRNARSPPLSRQASTDARHAQGPLAGPPVRGMPAPAPPRPPSANPWDHKIRVATDMASLQGRTNVSRRAQVPVAESPAHSAGEVSPGTERRPTSGTLGPYESPTAENGDRRRLPANPTHTYGIFPAPATARPKVPTATSHMPSVIPENHLPQALPQGLPRDQQAAPYPYSPSSYSQQSRQRDSSVLSINSDLNLSSSQSQDVRSSATTGYESPRLSSATKSSHRMSQLPAGLEVVISNTLSEDSQGPIPVETEQRSSNGRPGTGRLSASTSHPNASRDCTITGNSSFYLAGGFCEGAREIARGGSGIKKSKKPVGFHLSQTTARCSDCAFELDFKSIESDINKEDKGNLLKCGIHFRIRFLQKCHIATKRNDDVLYGCPFCITNGHTIDDSDATVFFNVKTLFTHLNWHSRPLPELPGFTVIEGAEVPPEHHNDYDLHFSTDPVPHPVLEKAVDLSLTPTGLAREPVRKLVGQRLLPDRTQAHELATAARVTGLTWPEEYNGEWCLGWHDGKHASVPTECLALEPPPSHEIKMGGLSNIRAKVRWRFHPSSKDKGEWLSLSKGDTITNINWAYMDHWCWSGTNSKGKWGIFPQVFIDTDTMQETPSTPSDRMSVVSEEKKGGIFSMFSSRNKSGTVKRPSIGGSTTNYETTTGALASAFIYPTMEDR